MAMDITTLGISVDSRQVKQADKNLDNLSRTSSKAELSTKSLSTAFGTLKTVIGAYLTLSSAKSIANTADSFSLMEGRIRLVTSSTRELLTVQKELFGIAQESKVGLESTVDLYSRIARSTKSLGVSQKEMLDVTEAINKTFIISAATTESANAAIIQLGQGLSSGTLRGEELNSVMEQAPRLAEAIAKGMGVTIGQLRALGAEGKITAEKVFNAIKTQGSAIASEFGKMPLTIGQSLVQVKNSWTALIGAFDKETGASSTVAKAFSSISKYITENKDDIIEYAMDAGRALQLAGIGFMELGNLAEIGMLNAVKFVGESINSIVDGWDTMIVSMKNAFKAMIDFVGSAFYTGINYMLKLLSEFINKVSSSLGGVFEFIGQENPFGAIDLSIGQYTSSIEVAKKSTKELINLDWTKSNLEEAYKTQNELIKTGGKLWKEIALDTTDTSHAAADLNKHTEKTINSTNELSKAEKKRLEEYQRGLENAKNKLAEARLTPEEFKIKQIGDELNDLGKYLSQADLAEIYAAEIKKMKAETTGFVSFLDGAFKSGDFLSIIEGIALGDIEQLQNYMQNVILKGASTLANSIVPGSGEYAAMGLQMIGALFSSTVSQAEIDAARGRVELDDTSLKNLGDVFESAQYPMLEVTNKMHKHLRNMDANFYSVARAMGTEASAGGVDLTGANFVDTYKAGFLGFSSKTVSLIGTGLSFAVQDLGDVMNAAALNVQAYTTTLVEKSSWFGLSHSSKIKESFKDMPQSVVNDIADSFASGYEAIMTAGVALGLDDANLADALKNAELNIEKVDFTGLSPQEVSDRLSDTFSTALSGVVKGVEEFSYLVERYAKNAEYELETLIRIGTEYDQASHQFGLIGKTFADGGLIDVTKQVEVELTRTVDRWGNALTETANGFSQMIGLGSKETLLPVNNFTAAFIGAHEETWTEITDIVTQQVYSAQMQILDIVESAGGQQAFNDAMGSFMTNFYTDAEQLDFITKSMQTSFDTLGVEMPKTNDEFRKMLETMDTSTEEGAYLYGQLLLLADGFATMTKASDDLNNATGDISDAIKGIADAWLGNLSYMNMQQKAEFASGYLAVASSSQGAIDTVEAARFAAEAALRTSTTRAEYIPEFQKYINELEKKVPEATNDDLLEELRNIKNAVLDGNNIADGSQYQQPLQQTYITGARA